MKEKETIRGAVRKWTVQPLNCSKWHNCRTEIQCIHTLSGSAAV